MTDSEKFFLCIKNWLTVFLPRQRCLSENTIKAYKTTLNLLIKFLRSEKHLPINKIGFEAFNQDVVNEFIDWLKRIRKCSVSTQNSRLMTLRSFFHYASISDISNVSLELDIAKVPTKKQNNKIVDFLSENALKALLEVPNIKTKVGIRNRFFMILMYDTAARCQELLDLKLKDFIINRGKPFVYLTGKGGKKRSVPLLPKTVQHYEYYLSIFHSDAPSGEDFLFYTVSHNQRKQMSPDNVQAFMKNYGEQARKNCNEIPLRVHPHQLRHTRAMHLYRGGWPLPFVSELLGHAKITTTNIYAYADTEMKRKALEKAILPTAPTNLKPEKPKWQDDEDLILKLSGLK